MQSISVLRVKVLDGGYGLELSVGRGDKDPPAPSLAAGKASAGCGPLRDALLHTVCASTDVHVLGGARAGC